MRLFDEIVTRLGADADVCFGGAKAVLLVGKCAYFENVRGIASLSAEEAVLAFAGVRLRVTGRNMTVARYGGGDLLLAGDVRGVEAEGSPAPSSAPASREEDVRGGERSLPAGDVRGVEAEDQLPQPSASASREKGVRGEERSLPAGDVRGGGRSLTAEGMRDVCGGGGPMLTESVRGVEAEG